MIFRFDRYTLNSETRTLSCSGSTVTLTPKVFQTLLVLVENHSRVMSKDELFEHIWPRQTVEEANLTQNISILRKALEEATNGKKYIATFHGRGYRFVEPVEIDSFQDGPGTRGQPLEPAIDLLERVATSTVPELSRVPELSPPEDLPKAPSSPRVSSRPASRGRSSLIMVAILLAIALTAFLALRRPQGLRADVVEPTEITTLTRMEGAQYQPAWSADGKNLAFVSFAPQDRSSSVWVQAAGEVRPRLLISGLGEFSSPAWSPDGKSLAFIHSHQVSTEIVIYSLADSTSRRLTTLFPHRYGLDYRHLDWAPDSSLLAVDDKANETDPLSLYLVHTNDGEKLRLTYPNMDIIGDVAPRFSPDGTRVAFIRVKYQFVNDVLELPVTGGEARRVTNQSYPLGDVDWQTNDSVIFSGRLDNEFRFWRKDLRNQASDSTLASAVGSDLPLQLSISRRSGQLAFSAYGPDLNIWALDLTKLPSAPKFQRSIISTPGQDLEPSISPDGKRMAYRSDFSGKVQLWVSESDGKGAIRLNTEKARPSVYCWARDGKSLIFGSSSEPGLFEVSVTSEYPLRRIPTALPLSHPACSVDGKSVYAINRNFLYRVSLADGRVEKITDQGGAPIVESGDGRYLYFAQGRMDSTISRFDLSTMKQTVIVSSVMPGYSDSWVATSKGILFLSSKGILFLSEESTPVIKFHSFATGKEATIAEVSWGLPPVGLSGFSLSPDERTLFVVRADPVSSNIQATNLPVTMR